MNETEHLLTVLSEECAEVAQRASKAARFGLSEIQPGQPEDNKRRLERELADLMATADLLGLTVRDEDKAAKLEKLKKFMAYSRENGTLEDRDKLVLQIELMQKVVDAVRDWNDHSPALEPVEARLVSAFVAYKNFTEKQDWAICGWCAGTGKEYGSQCPKCHGAGGFALKRVEGV